MRRACSGLFLPVKRSKMKCVANCIRENLVKMPIEFIEDSNQEQKRNEIKNIIAN